MPERLPESEFSEREQMIIARLREAFPDDPETNAMIVGWVQEEEEKATQIAEAGGIGDAARANIMLDLKKARLYKAAGYNKQVWETLNWVVKQATYLGDEDLRDQANAMMDEMDAEDDKEKGNR
jgi:hypothetical protein